MRDSTTWWPAWFSRRFISLRILVRQEDTATVKVMYVARVARVTPAYTGPNWYAWKGKSAQRAE